MSAKYRRRRRLEKDRYYKVLANQIAVGAAQALANFIFRPQPLLNFTPDPKSKYTGKIYYLEFK